MRINIDRNVLLKICKDLLHDVKIPTQTLDQWDGFTHYPPQCLSRQPQGAAAFLHSN